MILVLFFLSTLLSVCDAGVLFQCRFSEQVFIVGYVLSHRLINVEGEKKSSAPNIPGSCKQAAVSASPRQHQSGEADSR